MRGADIFIESVFTKRKLEDIFPAGHPLPAILVMVNEALAKMGDLFSVVYAREAKGGRPMLAPEKLVRALLLQVLFSACVERHLMKQFQYNLLFRCFIDLSSGIAAGPNRCRAKGAGVVILGKRGIHLTRIHGVWRGAPCSR